MMTALLITMAGLAVAALFLSYMRRNGAYPLFGGKLLVKARLARGDGPGFRFYERLILPLRLFLIDQKLRLLSPFVPMTGTSVRLSYAPVRKGSCPRSAGWEVYSQSGFMRAYHVVNLSLAGLITAFLLVYGLMGFAGKKAALKPQVVPSHDPKPPSGNAEILLVSLPGDCPPRLLAADCPVRFAPAGRHWKEDGKLIASLQTPTTHSFKKKGGGTHVNTPGSHTNTAGTPHSDVAAVFNHFNAHTNITHTNTTTAGRDHVNVDTRPKK
jgi:hypothetical protein